ATRAQQPAANDPLSTYLRRAHSAAMKDLAAIVDIMPEQDFGFRPVGAVNDVRTFGGIVHHAVAVTSWMCSLGDGKPDPVSALGPNPIIDKARLVALVSETNARCTTYLTALTDAGLA